MTTIAFLGLGAMGHRMALRLAGCGLDLRTWNRTPGATVTGALGAESPIAAATQADIVITMLTDAAAVEEVLFGPSGAAPGMKSSTCLIEMSTIGPEAVSAIAQRLPVPMIDCPVLGSVDAAATGTLQLLAGGDRHLVDRVSPVLAHLGTVRYCGNQSAGAAAKVVANASLLVGLAAVAEIRRLARAAGVDPETILARGPLREVLPRTAAYEAHYPARMAQKDLRLALAILDAPLLQTVDARLSMLEPSEDIRHLAALPNEKIGQ